MEFPKQFMTIRELTDLGLSKKYLRQIANNEGYPICFRESLSKTATIKFDTVELGKYLKRVTRIMERR